MTAIFYMEPEQEQRLENYIEAWKILNMKCLDYWSNKSPDNYIPYLKEMINNCKNLINVFTEDHYEINVTLYPRETVTFKMPIIHPLLLKTLREVFHYRFILNFQEI